MKYSDVICKNQISEIILINLKIACNICEIAVNATAVTSMRFNNFRFCFRFFPLEFLFIPLSFREEFKEDGLKKLPRSFAKKQN